MSDHTLIPPGPIEDLSDHGHHTHPSHGHSQVTLAIWHEGDPAPSTVSRTTRGIGRRDMAGALASAVGLEWGEAAPLLLCDAVLEAFAQEERQLSPAELELHAAATRCVQECMQEKCLVAAAPGTAHVNGHPQ